MEYSVFDTHCDTLCEILDKKGKFIKNSFNIDLERMRKYGEYTQVMACFIAPKYKKSAVRRTMRLIKTYKKEVLKTVKDEIGINTLLSIEGGEGITSISKLRKFHRMGVRMIALTWNFRNRLASGADEKDGGVTEFGERVIDEMNRLGIFLDVSHLNDQSFYDAVKRAKLPIIASHSCSRSVFLHRRNLTDDMFKIIVKSGGCVGINLYPKFLTGTEHAVIDDVIRHIEHFMSIGGENHIGLGCDFDGVQDCLPDGIHGCEDLYKLLDRLLQLNYSEEQVKKISSGNFKRIFDAK